MKNVTTEKRYMYDLLVRKKIMKKMSSGIYMLLPRGMNIYLNFEQLILNLFHEQLNIAVVDFPLIVLESKSPKSIIEKYSKICFFTESLRRRKYILASDICLFEDEVALLLEKRPIMSNSIRFRNNYEPSDSKKRLFQYHSFEFAFSYLRDWKGMKKAIHMLSRELGINLFIRRKDNKSKEFNILAYGTQSIYECKKCKKKYLFNEGCCAEIVLNTNDVYYVIAHIQIDNDIGYMGFSFENLIGFICEVSQHGDLGILPLPLENREVIITNTLNPLIQEIYNYFYNSGYNVYKKDGRVQEVVSEETLIFGYDEKKKKFLIYDGYTEQFSKLNENEMKDIMRGWKRY